jgi:hypothetical protein
MPHWPDSLLSNMEQLAQEGLSNKKIRRHCGSEQYVCTHGSRQYRVKSTEVENIEEDNIPRSGSYGQYENKQYGSRQCGSRQCGSRQCGSRQYGRLRSWKVEIMEG